MNSGVIIPRNLIIYGLCIPMAILMGYLLTTPLDYLSLLGVGIVMAALLIPVLLRWHHVALIVTWNAVLNAFFLPGQPRMWMVLALVSIGYSILDRIMDKSKRLQMTPWISTPLILLAILLLVTAKIRGGLGFGSIGGSVFGGRKYLEALIAIAGFFALSWQRVPPQKALLYSSLFFLSGITNVVSNLAYSSGIYWLFWLFPVDYAVLQIRADFSVDERAFSRLTGLAFACTGPFCFILLRHGIKGVLDFSEPFRFSPFSFRGGFGISQPYRPLFLVGLVLVSMFGGFRSMPIILGLIFAMQFILEGLHKTRVFAVILALGLLGASVALPFTERLPLVVQRTICFLPVKVNPAVRFDAWASTDWRLRMWNVIVEQIPRYFWVGKGYGGNAAELNLLKESMKRGYVSDFEGSYISGDYHSGPLSLMLPLGIFGALFFAWFLIAAGIGLYRNYRYGPPELSTVNTLLFAYFLAQTVFFLGVYGAFTSGLFLFTGVIAFSISLNGGICRAHQPVARMAPQRASPSAIEPAVGPRGRFGAPA